MRFFKKLWVYTATLVVTLVLLNFLLWFIHHKSAHNVLKLVQKALADNGITLSYQDVEFYNMRGWHLFGRLRAGELYAGNRNLNFYINIGDIAVESNLLKSEIIITFSEQMPASYKMSRDLMKHFSQRRFADNIKLNFKEPLSAKLCLAHRLLFIGEHKDVWLKSVDAHTEQVNIVGNEENLVHIKNADMSFSQNSKNKDLLSQKQGDASAVKTKNGTDEKAGSKILDELDLIPWKAVLSINDIQIFQNDKLNKESTDSVLGKINLNVNIEKDSAVPEKHTAHTIKSSESTQPEVEKIEEEDLNNSVVVNVNYKINNLAFTSKLFSVGIKGNYGYDLLHSEKMEDKASAMLSVRNYPDMCWFYANFINSVLKQMQSSYTITDKALQALKLTVPRIWQVEKDDLTLECTFTPNNGLVIGGYTMQQLSDKITQIEKTLSKEEEEVRKTNDGQCYKKETSQRNKTAKERAAVN
ncbi:hypothetical protein MIDIC_110048 [Alphaproteobacteria bacterium]